MNLYVGNLGYGTSEDALRELFGSCGEVVSAKVIMDRDTGRSRGFAFVEMAEKADGIKAISNFDGYELDGRNLRVNEAQQKPAGGGGRNRY